MGKRIKDTKHLSIHINYPQWDSQSPGCTVYDLIRCLFGSGHELNPNMETLEVVIGDSGLQCPNGSLLGWLQDWAIASCTKLRTMSLSLVKAPSWLVNGPSLRHICLLFPSRQTAERLFVSMFGFDSKSLPNLETLFLQGSPKELQLRCIDFRDSERLQAVHIYDCWIDDLSLPSFCKVSVSAQSGLFIAHMDELRGHPLVSSATHVCLPTDLADKMTMSRFFTPAFIGDSLWGIRQSKSTDALGIPDMFPAMRSLHLTWPQHAFRAHACGLSPWDCNHNAGGCFPRDHIESYQPEHDTFFVALRCLSPLWHHGNLTDLIIEGASLEVLIPALPCLRTLHVSCIDYVAVNFVDPVCLGHTITKMGITGKRICLYPQQHSKLCEVLKARNLELIGNWSKYVSIHAKGRPSPTIVDGYQCSCKACPRCLGIGVEG